MKKRRNTRKVFATLFAVFALVLGIGIKSNHLGAKAETEIVLEKLGTASGLAAAYSTDIKQITVSDYTLNYKNGKKQGDAIILEKSTNAFISNATPIPGDITEVTLLINKGASGKTTYGVDFSDTEILSVGSPSNAVNIAGENSSTFENDAGGSYFAVLLGNANNGQVHTITVKYVDVATSEDVVTALTVSPESKIYTANSELKAEDYTVSVVKNGQSGTPEDYTVALGAIVSGAFVGSAVQWGTTKLTVDDKVLRFTAKYPTTVGGSVYLHADVSLTVNYVAATSVNITAAGDATIVDIDKTLKLDAEVLPVGSNQAVTWSVSPAGIVTIDADGLVTGVAPGNVEVSATSTTPGVKGTFTLTVPAAVVYDGFEGFEGATGLTTTYANGSFEGASGVTFTYGHSRNEGPNSTSNPEMYDIDGKGLMLRRASDSFIEFTLTEGLSYLQFDYRRAFTATTERQLELIINGEIVQTGEIFGANGDVFTLKYEPEVAFKGTVSVKIKNVGETSTNRQATIDNIGWVNGPEVVFGTLDHIVVNADSVKKSYFEGESLSLAGLIALAYDEEGNDKNVTGDVTSDPVEGYTFTSADALVGTKLITVSYTEGETEIDTFAVTVIPIIQPTNLITNPSEKYSGANDSGTAIALGTNLKEVFGGDEIELLESALVQVDGDDTVSRMYYAGTNNIKGGVQPIKFGSGSGSGNVKFTFSEGVEISKVTLYVARLGVGDVDAGMQVNNAEPQIVGAKKVVDLMHAPYEFSGEFGNELIIRNTSNIATYLFGIDIEYSLVDNAVQSFANYMRSIDWMSEGDVVNEALVKAKHVEVNEKYNLLSEADKTLFSTHASYEDAYDSFVAFNAEYDAIVARETALAQAKVDAAAAFEVFIEADYSEENWLLVVDAKTAALSAISEAQTITVVNDEKAAGLAAIAAIKTAAQEAADALADEKVAAKAELDAYLTSLGDVSAAVETIITNAKVAIDGAEEIGVIAGLVTSAKADVATQMAAEAEAALLAAKNAAKAELDAYLTGLGEVSEAVETIITNAKATIDGAEEIGVIAGLVTDAKAAVVTQLDVEVAAALQAAKDDAKADLDAYLANIDDPSKAVKGIINDAKDTIQAQADASALAQIVADTKAAVDAKIVEEVEAPLLAQAKADAKADLDEYLTGIDNPSAQVKAIIASAKSAIDGAEDINALDGIVADAKTAVANKLAEEALAQAKADAQAELDAYIADLDEVSDEVQALVDAAKDAIGAVADSDDIPALVTDAKADVDARLALEAAAALQAAKDAAKAEIDAYLIDIDEVSAEVQAIVDAAKVAIDKVEDVDDIPALLSAAKLDVDTQVALEVAAAELAAAKADALAELQDEFDSYKETDYNEANWTILSDAYDAAVLAINDAADITAVDVAKDAGLDAMSTVKTLAIEAEEALQAAKDDALAELQDEFDSYKEADYSEANWTILSDAYDAAVLAINDAADITAVDVAKDAGLDAMSTVKTLAIEAEEALQAAKDAAKAELDAYLTDLDEVSAEVQAIVDAAKAAIDAVNDAAAIPTLVTSAKADVDAQVALEVAAAELAAAKAAAEDAINDAFGALKEADYSPDNWAEVVAAKDAALSAIDSAESVSAVSSAKEAGLDAMAAVKTLAEENGDGNGDGSSEELTTSETPSETPSEEQPEESKGGCFGSLEATLLMSVFLLSLLGFIMYKRKKLKVE